jgi:predicted nucleic acid-binding protein
VNGWLLDVNVLLGCAWKSHADHAALLQWLLQTKSWATCPLAESGFVRISMTTAYRASFEDARKSLATLRALSGHHFVADNVDAASLPTLTSSKDTTDAHLVTLAKRHGLKLATLDGGLIGQPWAAGIAENPLLSPKPSSTNG